MELKEERVQTLELLGLTLCQERIYLALARLGIAKTKTISKVSGVSQQDVYRIMPELRRLGLVEKAVSKPTMFKAVPMNDAVSILMERKNEEYKKVQAKSAELLNNFGKNDGRTTILIESPQFFLIPKQECPLEAAREFEKAKMSIDSMISLKKFSSWIFNSAELYEKALKRGVKIRKIITVKSEDKRPLPEIVQDLKKNPHCKIKYIPIAPKANIRLYDEKVAYIDTSPASGVAETACYCTSNPSLLAIIEDYFEMLWLTALEDEIQQ